MGNSIDPNIVLIDKRARELGITLGEKGVNRRELTMPIGMGMHAEMLTYELNANGPLIRCRTLTGDDKQHQRTENVSVDQVIALMETMSGTKR